MQGREANVTKGGFADMVVVSAEALELLEAMESQARVERAVELVEEGIEAVSRGEYRDAFEAIAPLRDRYGL